MRYVDGGSLTAEGRVHRERVRQRAAQMYEQGMSASQISGALRVSMKSVS
jgi:hypothetical protein